MAHTPELDVSSCGSTKAKALGNLKAAVRLFLEEAEKMGTLERILDEAGYLRVKSKLRGPKLVSVRQVSLPMPLENVKA